MKMLNFMYVFRKPYCGFLLHCDIYQNIVKRFVEGKHYVICQTGLFEHVRNIAVYNYDVMMFESMCVYWQ